MKHNWVFSMHLHLSVYSYCRSKVKLTVRQTIVLCIFLHRSLSLYFMLLNVSQCVFVCVWIQSATGQLCKPFCAVCQKCRCLSEDEKQQAWLTYNRAESEHICLQATFPRCVKLLFQAGEQNKKRDGKCEALKPISKSCERTLSWRGTHETKPGV